MSKTIQTIRGMHDVLPEHIGVWQHIETVVRQALDAYGYQEIRMPLVEKTELFKRSIGEVTDIVEKEMYTFEDRNGDSLTLRPEATASCVRACMENGLLRNQIQRLWYMGPMFRHERPQKGRYRQFHQIGVEAFGLDGPDIDAELIFMTARLWRELGLKDLRLEINSLGSSDARKQYREKLVEYFSAHKDKLDEDSQRRLTSNPLRILDSKNSNMQYLIKDAPQMQDHLDDDSRQHFEGLKAMLDNAGIVYEENPRLVRGLDYYNKTVFEWVTDRLGAQGTVCAGGRFDGLVEQLGGKPVPAAGFAMGIERLVALMEELSVDIPANDPHAYLVMVGEDGSQRGMQLAEELRSALPQLRLVTNCGGGSFKSQFKRADKSGAQVVLVLGEDELANNTIGVKDLRAGAEQETVAQSEIKDKLNQILFR